jgi:hypothetical protein
MSVQFTREIGNARAFTKRAWGSLHSNDFEGARENYMSAEQAYGLAQAASKIAAMITDFDELFAIREELDAIKLALPKESQ